MAKPELILSLSKLSKKIDGLMQEQESLLRQLEKVKNENLELKRIHEEDVKLLQKALKESEFLAMSHRLAATPEALVAARNKISHMLRTIDSCIRMINED